MTLPYYQHIAPSDIPSASSGTEVLSAQSSYLGGMRIFTADTQNSYIEWPVLTEGGAWRLTLAHAKSTNHGIHTVTLDGDTLGTIDCYGAGTANNVTQLSSLSFATGLHLLRFTVATKHASSTGYRSEIQAISLLRTGA